MSGAVGTPNVGDSSTTLARWAWTVCVSGGLSVNAARVLGVLAWRAGPDHRAWPAVEGIDQALSVNVRTVQRALNVLKDHGLITPLANQKGGRKLTTVYLVNFDFTLTPVVTLLESLPNGKGDSFDPKRVTVSSVKGDT
ncbi:MAG: helix-turn-helix domain-containing protein, partial [Gammaproteobacteria bacterium]|nr:helix-turn-helix domain-containing protein [Gammaproteobacteria bacterium]